MENTGHNLLLRFIDSNHFSLFLCIAYLARYADNIGIHYYLCRKLHSFPYLEIEFFLPQLCQIILTVPTESVALEEFLLEMCSRSTHSAVLTFWLLQAHLEDLSHDPEARSFQICRRVYNKVQYLLFGVGEPPSTKITANPGPALVLASAVMGVTAVPKVTEFMGPITIAQARKPRLRVFHLAPKLAKSRSFSKIANGTPKSEKDKPKSATFPQIETDNVRHNVEDDDDEEDEASPSNDHKEDDESFDLDDGGRPRSSQGSRPLGGLYGLDSAGISSLPDLRSHKFPESLTSSASMSSTSVYTKRTFMGKLHNSHHVHRIAPTTLTPSAKVRMLKTNYFRYETSFAYALQAISTRLRLVPKPARLSALRAEITLLNNELPAEVDIPMILETDTYRATPRQHKIVRISPVEATILNSAERVPFLLIIEVLRDDITFDPDTPRNHEILNNPTDYRSLFDLAYSSPSHHQLHIAAKATPPKKVINPKALFTESEMGDISASPLTVLANGTNADYALAGVDPANTSVPVLSEESSKSSSPRTSDLSFAPAYQVYRQPAPVPKNTSEMNDIAVHMRTAATMLAQLDATQGTNGGTKLPKEEVQQIKSRIISSMQHLEEQNAFVDVEIPRAISHSGPPAVNKEVGERRLENDLKTGVIKSDASMVGFGEEWNDKKERIRKSSPYGHLPNWDLVSVIAKTGSDLRQEAFACQLIHAIKRIWEEADVEVWVRRMTILVTGAGSGLVETITNGVSIHSLKKALATSLLGPSETPHKGKVATLSEYFFRVFGVRGSERFKKAQAEFIKSLAAYSLICYILQIKDRHNGNILLDTQGHVIHIDFGFLLSNSPGSVGFEAAPFKLTQEYIELMDGPSSEAFETFRALVKIAFKALRKQADDIVVLVEMMQKESPLPCFMSGDATAHLLRQRFQLHMSETEVDAFVDNQLINKSMGSMYTRLYDQYQLVTQGIYS
ncbi:kinase-like domain-containing protein [Lipomyces orientalis]|uniref:Kinase-like domain-containing protein n=1 Tax=Lipomyces orientalis TaxID=1233043 RepID=A0ACC3TPI0_9ASCO